MLTTLTAWGEGGHNYVGNHSHNSKINGFPLQHHTFPQDYRTSEMLGIFNFSRVFIEFFAKIGWAYDLKTMDEQTVARQQARQLDKLLQAEAKQRQQKGGRKLG